MARITCAISGIRFTASFLESISIPHTEGYMHPIFALPRSALYPLYTKHCKGELTATDSYLTFLAFFHSSGQVEWKYPASCKPNDSATRNLVDTNFSSLVRVLEQSDLISHPRFEQPSFKVYYDNSNLKHLPNWIRAWKSNIHYFYTYKASQLDIEALQKLENKLSYHILSGEKPEKYARVIANWAAKAGDFPPSSCDLWKETIRTCFSATKMFNTPLALLKEIKEHIELNIEVGSIHFHTLSEVLREGIAKHQDYLGGYTLLPALESDSALSLKGAAEVATLLAAAPPSLPKKSDYSSTLEFLQAKLAYRVACTAAVARAKALKEVALKEDTEQREEAIEAILHEEEVESQTYSLDVEDIDSLTIIETNEE